MPWFASQWLRIVFYLQIFRKSVEFCNEHEVWKLNVAHVLFMQVRITHFSRQMITKKCRKKSGNEFSVST